MKDMNTKKAWDLVGGLSKPGKMPGWAIGIPAAECNTGSKLRLIPDSVCSTCYALKGCYVFKVVQDAQYRRLKALKNKLWVYAMVTLINSKKSDVFRWHDSGDVQNLEPLQKIFEVCIHFWKTKKSKMKTRLQYLHSTLWFLSHVLYFEAQISLLTTSICALSEQRSI